MSGSWIDRVEAGLPLKPADVGNALKDLRRLQAVFVDLDGRDAGLVKRLEDIEAKLAEVVSRLGGADAAKPAKAQGGKAGGGSS